MGGGQPGAVFLAAAHQVLDLAVLDLGAAGPAAGVGRGGGQAVQLLLGGGAAAVGGADLLAEPGDPLAAGGGGPGPLGQAALGGGQLGLGGGPLGDGGGQDL